MNYLPIFVAITSVAVVIQAGILAGMFFSMRKTSSRMEALAADVSSKILPTAELAHSILTDVRPKIENIAANVSASTTLINGQIERLDATVGEFLDRARIQVIRTDELVGRALDRVEATSESVQKTVSVPVRQFSGLMRGVSAGLEYLATKKRREPAPQDEMFI